MTPASGSAVRASMTVPATVPVGPDRVAAGAGAAAMNDQ